MDSWGLYLAALAAVVLQARMRRGDDPDWYMGCIVPLLYGAAVAWLFVGRDVMRTFQVILFGAAIPISWMLSARWRRREETREREERVEK